MTNCHVSLIFIPINDSPNVTVCLPINDSHSVMACLPFIPHPNYTQTHIHIIGYKFVKANKK